jgi:hypothetical protein
MAFFDDLKRILMENWAEARGMSPPDVKRAAEQAFNALQKTESSISQELQRQIQILKRANCPDHLLRNFLVSEERLIERLLPEWEKGELFCLSMPLPDIGMHTLCQMIVWGKSKMPIASSIKPSEIVNNSERPDDCYACIKVKAQTWVWGLMPQDFFSSALNLEEVLFFLLFHPKLEGFEMMRCEFLCLGSHKKGEEQTFPVISVKNKALQIEWKQTGELTFGIKPVLIDAQGILLLQEEK